MSSPCVTDTITHLGSVLRIGDHDNERMHRAQRFVRTPRSFSTSVFDYQKYGGAVRRGAQPSLDKIFMVDGDDGAGNKMKEVRIPARLVASGRVLMGLHSCCCANLTGDIILGDLFQY